MNKVLLVGRITHNIEKRITQSGRSVISFSIAAQKNYKNTEGKYDADFINCVAWGGTADFIEKYFRKGSCIGLTGSLQSRSYDDKSGNKRYITEVLIEEVEFVGNKLKESSEEEFDKDGLFGEEVF